MKSTRRHELQHNTLDAELAKLIGFFKKWGTHLAWSLLIGALVALVAVYAYKRKASRQYEMQAEYERLVTDVDPDLKPDDRLAALIALEDREGDNTIAALACIEVGNEYASRVLIGSTGESEDSESPADLAREHYRKAIELFGEEYSVLGKAWFGLGKLEESLGNYDAARDAYMKIGQITQLRGYPVAKIAEVALQQLEVIKDPVKMATTAPSQPSEEAETSEPIEE